MDLEPGVVLAQRYRIQRPLGRGGMGEVFAAENIRTGRVVAVKVLRADTKQKSSAVARFQREARAAGAINSDHVTQVLDVDDDPDHGIVIVFELLEGESLIERLKRTGPMSFDELHPIVEQVWMGLTDAHNAGIIHRDLKPSNVFIERRPDGSSRVKILDFGISKLPREVGGETLTEMGQSLGTFSFMPPEQIGKAKTVDHRADIYSAATLIFQALSGQLPYAAKNILQMVDLKTKSEPRALGTVLDTPVDPRLEEFLRRSLARNPEDRYATADQALAAWRELKRAPVDSRHDGRAAPVYAGAAARGGSHASSSSNPQVNAPIGPGRLASTAILHDPRAASGQSAASPHAQPRPGFSAPGQTPAPPGTQRGLGGTMAIPASPPLYLQRGQISGLPVVSADTTSEGGADQAATIAMPMRAVAQAVAAAQAAGAARQGPSVPRMHDDEPEKGGTQLMTHAMARQASSRSSGVHPNPLAGQSGPASGAQNPMSASGRHQAPQQALPGEDGLTTVYRRDRANTGGPRNEPTVIGEGRGGSRIGMVLGVLAFAIVGFAVAAVILHYVQTGRMIWE